MTEAAAEMRSVVIEREFAFPAERLWRALTQPHLIEEWLMKNDFKPTVGHRFNLRGEWGGVLDCEVLTIEPQRSLAYTWNFSHEDAAFDLKSVVTFTLTPTKARARICASSRRASVRARSRPMAARMPAGSSFSPSWTSCWRGPNRPAAGLHSIISRGGFNEFEYVDSTDPSLAVALLSRSP